MLYAEHRYGPLVRWSEDFVIEWSRIRCQDNDHILAWFDKYKARIAIGGIALDYLGRVMEGTLTGSVIDWRDLYLQAYQSTGALYYATVGLQMRLDHAIIDYNKSFSDT